MALVRVGECFKAKTQAEYEAKRVIAYANLDPRTEYRQNGMIRCKRCHMPKVADFPEYNFVTKCCCKCEQEAWERQRNGYSVPRRMKVAQIKPGDWNPFTEGV